MVARPNDHPEWGTGFQADRYNVTIPPPKPATPEELARRRELIDEIIALREEIGPIGISTNELIRQVRCDEDDFDY